MLAGELQARGHAVRGTSRDPARVTRLGELGVEGVLADPSRVGTLAAALEHVTVVCVLLASATGTGEELRALHGSRLEMLLTRVLDTTARGVVYEAAGTVSPALLADGAGLVRSFCEHSRIPYALLAGEGSEPGRWAHAAVAAIEGVLAPDHPSPAHDLN